MMMKSKDFEEKFIDVVKRYPLLYDMDDDNYKRVDLKEETWDEIGKKFNISGQVARKKFKSMRDYYYVLRRNEQTSSSSASAGTKRRWRYYENMTFLEELKKRREASSPLPLDSYFSSTSSDPLLEEMDSKENLRRLLAPNDISSIDNMNAASDSNSRHPYLRDESSVDVEPQHGAQTGSSKRTSNEAAKISNMAPQPQSGGYGLNAFFTSLAEDIAAANLTAGKIRTLKLKLMTTVNSFIEENS